MRRSSAMPSAREVEMEMLCKALQVAPVEELDLHLGVPLAQLPQLAVLARDERLLHHGDLDVEVLIREVEVGGERLRDATLLVLLEDEGPRLVFPRDAVVIEHLGALELRRARETRCLGPAICLENRDVQPHPGSRYRPRRTLKRNRHNG